MQAFESIDALARWLAAHGIDTARWGRGAAKTLANLWDEYVQGEAAFQDDPPLRCVEVVELRIRRNSRILLELEQEFDAGQRRARRRPPSEKLKPGESWAAGAARCLREELGLTPGEYTLDPTSHAQAEHLLDSPSYPGLPTRYTLHSVTAVAPGLPDADFWRGNLAARAGDPVRRHRWGWRRQAR